MAGDGRGLSLVGFPDDLLALIIENLSWEDRWRLAVTCRRLLGLVPSFPFQLPNSFSLHVFMHDLALAGWLRLVARTRGEKWVVEYLMVDLWPATTIVIDVDSNRMPPARAAPLPVWRSVATVLEHVAPRSSLWLQGLGLPAGAAPGAFTRAGHALMAAVRGFTNLIELQLHMGFQGAAPGQPFHARLNAGPFPRLERLMLFNSNDGPDGEVVLTLGHMPRLRFLNVTNTGRGGWVVPKEPLPRLGSITIGNSCPRFANLEDRLRAVTQVTLYTRRARGEQRWGREMVGCGMLLESLPAIEHVRVWGGTAGQFRLCQALQDDLEQVEGEVGVQAQVLGFPFGGDSDGENGA